MTLDILISTIDTGIERVVNILLPSRNDVKYIISHQYTDEIFRSIPKPLLREDIIVTQIPGRGLTKSRNHAIRLASGDICVIADDDVSYTNAYYDTIIEVYRKNHIDVASFKIFKKQDALDYKYYPNDITVIKNIFEYSPCSIEITFRRESILENGISFDERFGLGSRLNGGEESIFIYDCLNAGLLVKFFPYYIVQHTHDETILALPKYDGERNIITGALDARINGTIAYLKSFLRVLKYLPDLIKNKKNPLKYLWEMLQGVNYIVWGKLN